MPTNRLAVPFTRWRVFHERAGDLADANSPFLDLSHLRELPAELAVAKRRLEGVNLEQSSTALDLSPLTLPRGFALRRDRAWLFSRIDAEAERTWELSFGADWFAAWWCNGRQVASTFRAGGNQQVPPSPLDHDLTLELQPGPNLVAVEVLSGGDGFALLTADTGGRRAELRESKAAQRQAADAERRDAIRGPGRVRIDATEVQSTWVRPERYPSVSLWMAEPETVQAWAEHVGRPSIARVFGAVRCPAYNEAEPTPEEETQRLKRLRDLSSRCDELLTPLPWMPARDVMKGRLEEGEFASRLRRGLCELREVAPNCCWIEVFNETEVGHKHLDDDEYFHVYRLVCHTAVDVDRAFPGLPPLRLGGPCACSFNRARIRGLIQRIGESRDPSVRLDFVSWHQYLFRSEDRPAAVAGEADAVRAWLRDAGLAEGLPLFIDESGVFPVNRGTEQFANDLLTQCAGVLSLHYHYQERAGVHPFQWTWFHANPRKNQFAPTLRHLPLVAQGGREHDASLERLWVRLADDRPDRFMPFGHVARLQARMPEKRVRADAQPREAGGLGLYAIAAAEPGRIAALVWNYQFASYEDPQSYDVRVSVDLPPSWRDARYRETRYQIDLKRAHPLSDQADLAADPIASGRVSGASIETRLSLSQNAITLLEWALETDVNGA